MYRAFGDYFAVDATYSGPGYVLGATVGRTIAPNVRAEVELSYAAYEFDEVEYDGYGTYDLSGYDVTMGATYLMGKVWYDLSSIGTGATQPYVGGGLGVAFVDFTFFGSDFDTATALAVQLGAGVKVPLEAGALDIGYRFKTAPDFTAEFEGNEVGDGSTLSHDLQAAYVFNF